MTTSYALDEAFHDWMSGDLYLGNDGHYRLKSNKGRIAPYSKSIKTLYPDNLDFHRHAHLVRIQP